ncbi:hypothetical protein KIL84_008420 [Mauremys mutica]|uniref:Uncharacterized protein n=1 Tax=Mauremys mutica TaxID=74926 RepID=A0A9D4B0C2_9SAUR|nr:hypothetical protein KIL84_008420 [Mauremys mutica]
MESRALSITLLGSLHVLDYRPRAVGAARGKVLSTSGQHPVGERDRSPLHQPGRGRCQWMLGAALHILMARKGIQAGDSVPSIPWGEVWAVFPPLPPQRSLAEGSDACC